MSKQLLLHALTASLLAVHCVAVDIRGDTFHAGAAMSNITPMLGASLAGNMRNQIARNIHDELHVRCIALDDGSTRLAFAIVDSCMVPRDIIDAAKSLAEATTMIPRENMLVAATHSHTAACATPLFQSDPDPAYQQFLTRRIADGITQAVNNLEPARISWGSGSLPDEVFNRRWHMKPGSIPPDPFGETADRVQMNPPRGSTNLIDPAGPTDPEIAFVSIQSATGRPIALLANYSLHYVGGTGGGEVSGDYFAAFSDRIQELMEADRLVPSFVGIMTNGTSADINNINFRDPWKRQEPYAQITMVAHKVAAEVYRALDDVVYQDWVPLGSAGRDVMLSVRRPSEKELARARKIVEAAKGPEMKTTEEIYARETLLLRDYPAKVPVLLQVFRLGNLAMVQVPCEVFAEIGLDFKERSPFAKTFTVELANGYNGYLPTAEQHALGGYETWRARSSYLEVEAERTIRSTIFDLLEQLVPSSEE